MQVVAEALTGIVLAWEPTADSYYTISWLLGSTLKSLLSFNLWTGCFGKRQLRTESDIIIGRKVEKIDFGYLPEVLG